MQTLMSGPMRVRLLGWEKDKSKVEILGYINVRDYSKYLEIRENITLQILEAVTRNGTALALPSQTLHMGKDVMVSGNKIGDKSEG